MLHTWSKRFNALAALSFSTVMVIAGILSAVTLVQSPIAPATIRTMGNAPRVVMARDNYSKVSNHLAVVDLGLEVDLRDLFRWNTKMAFVYVLAQYSTPADSDNQIVLWDKRVLRGDDLVLNIGPLKSHYALFDRSKGLLDANVTLTFHWNIIPYAGFLFDTSSGETSIQLPSSLSQ